MKTYKCVKTVQAEKMGYHTAGRKGLIRDYDPNVENMSGYHVVYEDGYESWSPAIAFEKGYKEVNEENPIDSLDNTVNFFYKNKLNKLAYRWTTTTTNILEEQFECYEGLDSDAAREFARKTLEFMMDLLAERGISNLKSPEEIVDCLADTCVYSLDAVAKLGYEPKCVMNEVGKEINSRKQDPKQKEEWDKHEPNPNDKWRKDPNQPQEEKYKADFSKCKVVG